MPTAKAEWALLDHDISTVIYDTEGTRPLSLPEIVSNVKQLADPAFAPGRDHGWYISGLEDNDARGVYTQVTTAEYLAGYAGPPHGALAQRRIASPLSRAGTGRRQNLRLLGPQLQHRRNSRPDTRPHLGQSTRQNVQFQARHRCHDRPGRYANAVYEYTPNFADGTYRQGEVDEAADTSHSSFTRRTSLPRSRLT